MPSPTESKLTSDWDTAGHQSSGWPLFLTSVAVKGIRGWSGELVEFRYPVVAIAGANGSGKSTILKAAASAYVAPPTGQSTTFSPDDFFPNTPWEQVSDASITFSLRQGDGVFEVSLRKPTKRWRGFSDRKARNSYFLDVSRIQPANTQIGYGKTAQKLINDGEREVLNEAQTKQLSRAIGKTYDNAAIESHESKQVGILTQAGRTYSNFHQGAGEDSVLDLIYLIGRAPRNSLVIIDEIEAALHPRAQRGLITELLEIAKEKRLQIILSTHSPNILEQLPPRARIYVASDRDGNRDVLYGVTTEFAMGLMDNEHHVELDIYCEDTSAAVVVDHLLRASGLIELRRVKITPVGPSNVVKSIAKLASEAKLPRAAIGVLDADQIQSVDCVKLPGTHAPEKELFEALGDRGWESVSQRLGYSAGEVLDARDQAMALQDHHTWCGKVAGLLGGLTRPTSVWDAIVDVWVRDVIGEEACQAWASHVSDKLRELV